jgi:7-carboxy-7-deazaguanine synthase (Cx14CxxC type)
MKAICKFCDTDFVGVDGTGGGVFQSPATLANTILAQWPSLSRHNRFVVCTGGEPLAQLDRPLIEELHQRGFEIAVETNGTKFAPSGIDWVCVSPKAGAPLVLRSGNELKVVVPQAGLNLVELEDLDFEHFFVQPMAGDSQVEHTRMAVDWCLVNPRWRLSLQTHKYLGIP